MKLLRYGNFGAEKPGVLDTNGNIRDLSHIIDDITGQQLLPQALNRLRDLDIASLPIIEKNDMRIAPCIKPGGKFICIGLNYYDHAAEVGLDIPKEPLIFNKATSSICGPYDDIIMPKGATQIDWEVELGVVIGKPAKYISTTSAHAHIAGYCIINDVTERSYQFERGGQWTKGKSCDFFGPIGPWLVTTDEIDNSQNLDLWLTVDGVIRQKSNTKNMIFDVPTLISYLSQFFTLYPGDIIATGTPAGVGHGIQPSPIYLKAGQTMALGISNLGHQRQTIMMNDELLIDQFK
jgi:2-keto-4-pentenoate hydratase/2-oxohepta-3-ene-1,7-dioic acid hydratase in catechol pathway